MTQVLSADFLGGAPKVASLPAHALPEIAFFGRSNVGKSTLINRLTNRKQLARVSATPGRTQEINLFTLRLRDEDGSEQQIVIADLPGFGYARASHAKRSEVQSTIEDYLENREKVLALCLLSDARRGPEAEEIEFYELASSAGRHLIAVLTKGDKLSQIERAAAKTTAAAAYHLLAGDVVITGEGQPLDDLWLRLKLLLKL